MELPHCPHIPASKKVLVLCEKPSVARDLAKVLGGGSGGEGYIPFPGGYISWAVGHMLELVEPEEYNPNWSRWDWSVLPMIPEKLQFISSVKASCRAQIAVVKSLYAKSDILVNACDAGREGELIWWEVVRYCGWGKNKEVALLGDKPAFRFWAQSNTPEGQKEAWEKMKPVKDWLGLAQSAYCRSEGDWLLGLNATRAATLSFPAPITEGKRGFWSVGRVQTPVLALISSKDDEINNFKSRPFYEVRASFQGEEPFEGTLLVPSGVAPFIADEENPPREVKAFLKKADAQEVLARVLATAPKGWLVKDEQKNSLENPPLLFSLTDLQKWCNQAWGWSAKQTLDAAQDAYEKDKTLSYPRTDAAFLPKDAKDQMDEVYHAVRLKFLDKKVSLPDWVLEPSVAHRSSYLFDDSKLTDHYAIVPTGVIPHDFDSNSGKVWLAVVRRFLVAFCPPAKVVKVSRRITFGEDVAVASGKYYEDRAWLDVDDALASLTGHSPKEDPDSLPACGVSVPVFSGRLHEGKTTPPKPYTESTLLAIMENIHTKLDKDEEDLKDVLSQKGIGTPATRATIIELLIARGYIVREKKVNLRVTEAGKSLIDNLRSVDLSFLTQPDMTAEWEQQLLLMEKGKGESRDKFLNELSKVVESLVFRLKTTSSIPIVERVDTKGICPLSGKPIVDGGDFWEFPGIVGRRLYKELSGRKFTLEEMVMVIEGTSPVFEGFVSRKKGTMFSAGVSYDPKEKKLIFVFSDAPQAVKHSGSVCPLSGEPIRDCGGYWEYPNRETKFWKNMCKRKMSLDEYSELVEKEKTHLLDGFVSGAGNKFSAHLIFKPNGDVGFEFLPKPAGGYTPTSPKLTGPGAKAKGTYAKPSKKSW